MARVCFVNQLFTVVIQAANVVAILISEYLLGDITVDISSGYFYIASMSRPVSQDLSDSTGIYRARIDGSNLSPVFLITGGDNFIFSLSYNWAAGNIYNMN
jgi:hypothetical protein